MHFLAPNLFTTVFLLGGLVTALPYTQNDINVIRSTTIQTSRSPDTCADPSLADVVFQAFNAPGTAHQLTYLQVFETVNSENANLVFANELPAFNAWPTQQEFLSPLFQLGRQNPNQVIYALGADAQTPPVINGFTNPEIVAWAYSTQICGSVPLMSATLASASDSFYTISPTVHSGLIANGWSDSGVVAFVLPLNSS